MGFSGPAMPTLSRGASEEPADDPSGVAGAGGPRLEAPFGDFRQPGLKVKLSQVPLTLPQNIPSASASTRQNPMRDLQPKATLNEMPSGTWGSAAQVFARFLQSGLGGGLWTKRVLSCHLLSAWPNKPRT